MFHILEIVFEMVSTANEKLLDVFEHILSNGSMSASDLNLTTGMSRTAIHRALKTLEARNFIRQKLGGHHYAISSAFAKKVKAQSIISINLEALIPKISNFCRKNKLHCDVVKVDNFGGIKAIESSDSNFFEIYEDLRESSSLLLAQCAMVDEFQISTILKNRFPDLDNSTRHQIRNRILVQSARSKDLIFDAKELGSSLIGLQLSESESFVFNLRPRVYRSMSLEMLHELAIELKTICVDEVATVNY